MYHNILHLSHISAVWSHQQRETAQVSLSKSKSPLLEKREMRIVFLAENTALIFRSNVESNTHTHTQNRFKGTQLFWREAQWGQQMPPSHTEVAVPIGRVVSGLGQWDYRWIIWKGPTCFNTSSQGEVFYLSTTLTHVLAIDAAN